jgi:uncharacterized protein (TIGR02597 family)
MKALHYTIALLTVAGISSLLAAQSGVTETTVGSQYIWAGAGSVSTIVTFDATNSTYSTNYSTNTNVTVVAPEFQPSAVGSFVISSVATNTTNAILSLVGNPPVDSYGVPLATNEFKYAGSNQPNTYYTIVTDGSLSGTVFTVVSNGTNSITVITGSVPLKNGSIRAVELRPYWTLATMFPANMATNSFVPTTNSTNVMTRLIIAPAFVVGVNSPQQSSPSYYFNASLTNWVNSTNPTVSAADTIVPPGSYIYFQNDGGNLSYPVNIYLSGTSLKGLFRTPIYGSTNLISTCISLPRSSPYKLSQIGLNDSNFTQSLNKSTLGRNDTLVIDNGHGKSGGVYYKFRNQWYKVGDDAFSSDPTLAPGSAFRIAKPPSASGTSVLVNTNNIK